MVFTVLSAVAELERSLIAASTGASGMIKQSAGEVERALTGVSTGVDELRLWTSVDRRYRYFESSLHRCLHSNRRIVGNHRRVPKNSVGL